MTTTTLNHDPRETGTVYIVMLAVLSIVMTISLSSLINARTELAATTRTNEEANARSLARSALELAIEQMESDPAWRESVSGATLIGTTTFGADQFRVLVQDPVDGDLLDRYDDPVELLAEAQSGQSIQKLFCRIDYSDSHDRSIEPIMSRHPISYWTLRELSGKDSPDQRSNNDAELKGTLTYNLVDTTGVYRMPQLSTVDQTYYAIPHQSSMELDYGSFCFWMQPSATYAGSSLTQVAVSKWEWDEAYAAQVAIVCTNGSVYLVIDHEATIYPIEIGPIMGDEWHHVLVTWGASGWKTYLDGTAGNTLNTPMGLGPAWTRDANQMDWYIGAADDIYRRFGATSGMNNFFNGKICDFAIFAYELDAAAIKTLAKIKPEPVPHVLDHESVARYID